DPALVSFDFAERNALAVLGTAANLGDQEVAFDDRRTANAEEILHDAEFRLGVYLPDEFAIRGAKAVQHPLDAEDVYPIAVNYGAAPWTVIVAVLVIVIGRVLEFPKKLSSLAFETTQSGRVTFAVEVKQTASGHGGHAIAGADLLVPDDAEAVFGPG